MWGIIKLNVEIFENNKLCNLYKTLHLCAKATSQPKASDGRTVASVWADADRMVGVSAAVMATHR